MESGAYYTGERPSGSERLPLACGATFVLLLVGAAAVPRWVGWPGLVSVPIFLAGAAGFPGIRMETLNYIAFSYRDNAYPEVCYSFDAP